MITSIALGLVVGSIMALTGAGGGILAVPLLVFGLHMSVGEAGPIGLLAVGISAAIGAALGLKDGIVRYRAALLMAAMGILLSPVGIWLARRIDAQWLSIIFSGVLTYVAYGSFKHADNFESNKSSETIDTAPCARAPDGRFIWTSRCTRTLGISGALAGLLSGLLGVGGGFVMVPSLRRYSDLNTRSIIATSLAVTALIAASGIIFNASTGRYDWNIALPFVGGAVAGLIVGLLLSRSIKGQHLQKGFAIVTAVVAVGMIFKVVQ